MGRLYPRFDGVVVASWAVMSDSLQSTLSGFDVGSHDTSDTT
jgi:hypothetical protein